MISPLCGVNKKCSLPIVNTAEKNSISSLHSDPPWGQRNPLFMWKRKLDQGHFRSHFVDRKDVQIKTELFCKRGGDWRWSVVGEQKDGVNLEML